MVCERESKTALFVVGRSTKTAPSISCTTKRVRLCVLERKRESKTAVVSL